MEVFIGWIAFSFAAGYIGDTRKIGFWTAFLLSIFLSPLLGLIIAFASDKKAEIRVSPTMAKLIDEGDTFFREGKIEDSIVKFISALTYSDKAPQSNFKLAKLYSLKKDGENSLKHLAKAIQDGFNEFEKINQDNDLSYLRSIPDFKIFVANGYKMQIIKTESVRALSRIEELEKLNTLFEKGVLTKEEFENEKKRILSIAN